MKLWTIVTGGRQRPSASHPKAQDAWDQDDDTAMGWIHTKIDIAEAKRLKPCRTSAECLDVLRSVHRLEGVSGEFLLYERLDSIEIDYAHDLRAQLDQFVDIVNDIRNLRVECEREYEYECTTGDQSWSFTLLRALPRTAEGKQLRRSIIANAPKDTQGKAMAITLEYVVGFILQDAQSNAAAIKKTHRIDLTDEHKALATTGSTSSTNKICFSCQQPGHIAINCPSMSKRNGRASGRKYCEYHRSIIMK